MQVISDPINAAARRVPTWAVYLVGTLPFAWLLAQLFTGGLGVDPVKTLEHVLGERGLQFLIAGLAITPLRRHLNINLIKFRRALGLIAFFYIAAHLLVWLLLDIQLLWGQIWADILKRPYITIGMAGFVMLLPLAMTSNNWSARKMGAAAWRRLHKITYFAVLAGSIHFVMVVKGWQIEPFLYLGVILTLLALRVKVNRRKVAA